MFQTLKPIKIKSRTSKLAEKFLYQKHKPTVYLVKMNFKNCSRQYMRPINSNSYGMSSSFLA